MCSLPSLPIASLPLSAGKLSPFQTSLCSVMPPPGSLPDTSLWDREAAPSPDHPLNAVAAITHVCIPPDTGCPSKAFHLCVPGTRHSKYYVLNIGDSSLSIAALKKSPQNFVA